MIDEHSPEIQEVAAQTSTALASAQTLTIAGDGDVASASTVLKQIADTKKSIEERRQFFVKPLNDQVKKINDLFKSLAAPLLEADSAIRSKVSAYRNAQAELARKEQDRLNKLAAQQQARLDKKAEQQGVEAPVIAAPIVAAPPKTVGNVTARKVWKWKVVNAAQVPEQYKVVDSVAVNTAVRSGERAIPGLDIYEEEQLAVR